MVKEVKSIAESNKQSPVEKPKPKPNKAGANSDKTDLVRPNSLFVYTSKKKHFCIPSLRGLYTLCACVCVCVCARARAESD